MFRPPPPQRGTYKPPPSAKPSATAVTVAALQAKKAAAAGAPQFISPMRGNTVAPTSKKRKATKTSTTTSHKTKRAAIVGVKCPDDMPLPCVSDETQRKSISLQLLLSTMNLVPESPLTSLQWPNNPLDSSPVCDRPRPVPERAQALTGKLDIVECEDEASLTDEESVRRLRRRMLLQAVAQAVKQSAALPPYQWASGEDALLPDDPYRVRAEPGLRVLPAARVLLRTLVRAT